MIKIIKKLCKFLFVPQRIESVVDVPCFKCLCEDSCKVSGHRCDPRNCEVLTKWLEREVQKE